MVLKNQVECKIYTLWMFLLLCRESYSNVLSKNNTKSIGTALETFQNRSNDVTTTASADLEHLVCHIHDKHSNYIKKCKKGYSCFSAIYVSYKDGSLHDVKHNQGCWSPEMAKKRNDNCSTRVCRFPSRDQLLNLNKTLSNVLFFCCCNASYCNNVKLFSGKIPQNSSSSPSTDMAAKRSSNSWLIYTILISSVASLCLFVCVMLLYCWKWRKKNPINMNKSKVLYEEYSTDTENINLSEQSLDNILHGNLIHQGHHNAIRLGNFQDKTVAVKVFPPRRKKQWCYEKKIYKILGPHPNIAEFITCNQFQDDISFEGVIVLAYYVDGSLLNYLRQHTLSWKQMIKFAYNIVNGLAFLHGEVDNQNGQNARTGIAHRDLNSSNILVKSDGTCVLADFGSALQLNGSPHDKFHLFGSIRYAAPELLDGSIIHSNWTVALKQVDSYALGLILWELARRCHEIYEQDVKVPECMLPYEYEFRNGPTLQKVKHLVCDNRCRPKFPAQWKPCNFTLSYLSMMIQECWDHDGDARLTPLCVLNRITQIQDMSSAEQLIYQETLGNNPGIFINDDFNEFCSDDCQTSSLLLVNDNCEAKRCLLKEDRC